MKRTILVGASLFALASGVSAQVGNISDFEAFKAQWKKSHNVITELTPAQYDQMKTEWVASTATETARKTPVELSTAEKLEQKKIYKNQSQGLPADFPMKANTGDPVADENAYQQAKLTWIQNNPEKYKQLKTIPKMSQSDKQAIRQQELNNQN
ncbi:MAG: hypothetical protein AB8B56_04710 [Crocinitomicaceae bacterium]